MKNNSIAFRRMLTVCSLCLVLTISLTGCEPLRKKFVRQKKKEKEGTGDFIPVLEPEIYPVKTIGPAEVYAQQYAMFNLWVDDFTDNFETSDNDKKLISDLDAALKSITEMVGQLKSPVREELAQIKDQVQKIREEIVKPVAFRNRSKIKSELRDLDRTIRKKYKPSLVAGSYITE